jgi:hypothetical protein
VISGKLPVDATPNEESNMNKRRVAEKLVVVVVALLTCSASYLPAQKGKSNVEPLALPGYTAEQLSRLAPAARPADVASPRAIVQALHASVNGKVEAFDWQRFRSLFLPGARIGEAGEETAGRPQVRFDSVEHWIQSIRSLPARAINKEVIFKTHVEQFGNIASVFYTHSAVFSWNGKVDDVRRVNSCQMIFDGRRWWITSVIWNDSLKKWDLPRDMEP